MWQEGLSARSSRGRPTELARAMDGRPAHGRSARRFSVAGKGLTHSIFSDPGDIFTGSPHPYFSCLLDLNQISDEPDFTRCVHRGRYEANGATVLSPLVLSVTGVLICALRDLHVSTRKCRMVSPCPQARTRCRLLAACLLYTSDAADE